jgi:hypothetical protein
MKPSRRSIALLAALVPLVAPTPAPAEPTGQLGTVALDLPGSTRTDADPTCDRVTQPDRWDATLRRALDLAAEPPAARSSWTVLDVTDVNDPGEFDAYGRVDLATGEARLSPLTPCWTLTSVVLHESAHRRQAALGLDQATYAADPLPHELAADCAAYRLVPPGEPTYAPYLVARHRAGASLAAPCYLG